MVSASDFTTIIILLREVVMSRTVGGSSGFGSRRFGIITRMLAVLALSAMSAVSITGCYTSRSLPMPANPPPTPPQQPDVIENGVRGGKYIELEPNFKMTLTLADLEVSEKRITGTVKGLLDTKTANLEKAAVAQALMQKGGADVLVGATFYYSTSEEKTKSVDGHTNTKRYQTVTVFGYPARYKNFRTYESKHDDVFAINPDSNPNNVVPQGVSPVIVPVQTSPANTYGQ